MQRKFIYIAENRIQKIKFTEYMIVYDKTNYLSVINFIEKIIEGTVEKCACTCNQTHCICDICDPTIRFVKDYTTYIVSVGDILKFENNKIYVCTSAQYGYSFHSLTSPTFWGFIEKAGAFWQ